MNLDEDELTVAHRIGEKPINVVDDRKIFFKPTRKQLSHRIFHASCELNPLFYVNYHLVYTRIKTDYVIRQLRINFPDKIRVHHSYNDETRILFNSYDYSSNPTHTLNGLKS